MSRHRKEQDKETSKRNAVIQCVSAQEEICTEKKKEIEF